MLEIWEFVKDEVVSNFGAIDGAIIPTITKPSKVVSMNMGEYIDVFIEGVLFSLAEIVNDDVGKIYFSHFAAKVVPSLYQNIKEEERRGI